jgi:hypothetical protein
MWLRRVIKPDGKSGHEQKNDNRYYLTNNEKKGQDKNFWAAT